MAKKKRPNFWHGVLFGLLFGVIGNLLVSSMYRMIDKTPAGHNGITFTVAALGIIIVGALMWRLAKRVKNG